MSDEEGERLALIVRGLAEARSTLEALPHSPEVALLLARATAMEVAVERWKNKTPTRLDRASMVNQVLSLNLEVSKLRREARE